jgi:Tfp pilus assembly major pilin PilA
MAKEKNEYVKKGGMELIRLAGVAVVFLLCFYFKSFSPKAQTDTNTKDIKTNKEEIEKVELNLGAVQQKVDKKFEKMQEKQDDQNKKFQNALCIIATSTVKDPREAAKVCNEAR